MERSVRHSAAAATRCAPGTPTPITSRKFTVKPYLLTEGKTDDLDNVVTMRVEPRVRKLFAGVAIRMRTLGTAASERAAGKPAQWLLTFQASKMVVVCKVGGERHLLGEFDVGAVADAKRRNEIVDALRSEGVIDAAEVAAFRRQHPDKDRLAQIKAAMLAKMKAIETLKSELGTLKAEFAANGG
jgi:hypothetical protein